MALKRRHVLSLASGGAATLLLSRWFPVGRAQAAWSLPPELAGLRRGDQRLALISDLNASYGSTSYVPQVHRGIRLLQRLQVDLVICAGDMVAGQKTGLSSAQLDGMWNAFDQQVLRPLRSAGEPFAPVIGNHDGSSSRGPAGFVFALDRERAEHFWRQRRGSLQLTYADASRFPFRYSFRQGDVFVVVLDASSAQVPEQDWAWADIQLAGMTARQARLRLVVGHLPPYGLSQGRDRPGEVLQRPERLRQLMARHDVHLYVSGHQHAWYAGRVDRTNLLGLGAMGSGPRQLLGGVRPPVQTLTLLDLFRDPNQVVETTVELNQLRPLPVTQLPPTLQPSTGPLLRRREGPINLG